MKYKFLKEFCDLLNINSEYYYSQNTILMILLNNSIKQNKICYLPNNDLLSFLNKILVMPLYGYYLKDLKKIISILIISNNELDNDYIIISNNENNIYINNLFITL
jgi:hypothetical protein